MLLVLLALVLLAGCAPRTPDEGTDGGLPRYYDAGQLAAAVGARERADRTARLTLSGELRGPSAGELSGEGMLRLADGVAVRFDPAGAAQRGFVVLPGAVYLRRAPGPGGRRWVRVDTSSTDPDERRQAGIAAAVADTADPTADLARYADATLITDAADDVVDGRPAVRYMIVVDLARAALLQDDPAMRAQLQQQVRAGLTRITSTLWVDAANRPVRSDTRHELPGVGTLVLSVGYRDWGRPVDVEAPPAEQVR